MISRALLLSPYCELYHRFVWEMKGEADCVFFPLSTVFFIEIDFVFATDNQPIDKEKEEHYFWNPLCLAIAISYANP